MTYKTEFPDFPADAMPALPAGFADRSWKNDACPCFIHGETGVVLWIDHPIAEEREFPETPRFSAMQCAIFDKDCGWQFSDDMRELHACEDWAEMSEFLTRK